MTFELGLRITVAAVLALMGSLTLSASSARGRERRGQRWARRNLAFVDQSAVPALDAWLTRRQRRAGVLALLCGVAMLVIPLGGDGGPPLGMWLVIAALGSSLTLLSAADFSRPFLARSTPALARVKAVSVVDYVPASVRILARLATALVVVDVGFVGLVAARRGSGAPWPLIAVGVMVVLGLAVAEWAGRHISDRPEPARDPADLYWQDAVRAEAIQAGFSGPLIWGVMVLAASPQVEVLHQAEIPFAFATLLISMGLGLGFIAASAANMSMGWTRKRLWPELAPGEIVLPGRAATSPPVSGVRA